jgi:hypothetical protein
MKKFLILALFIASAPVYAQPYVSKSKPAPKSEMDQPKPADVKHELNPESPSFGLEGGWSFANQDIGNGIMYGAYAEKPVLGRIKIGLRAYQSPLSESTFTFLGGFAGYSLREHFSIGPGEFSIIGDLGTSQFTTELASSSAGVLSVESPWRLGYGARIVYDGLFKWNKDHVQLGLQFGFMNSRPSDDTITIWTPALQLKYVL